MFEKFANIFRIPDLRKRIVFTLALLAVYRIGGHIPIPGVNSELFRQYIDQNRGTLLGFVDLFSDALRGLRTVERFIFRS